MAVRSNRNLLKEAFDLRVLTIITKYKASCVEQEARSLRQKLKKLSKKIDNPGLKISSEETDEMFSLASENKSCGIKIFEDEHYCLDYCPEDWSIEERCEMEKPSRRNQKISNLSKKVQISTVEPSELRLFVGGLNPKTNAESLRLYFSKWGDITDLYLAVDWRSGQSRGFGYITFSRYFTSSPFSQKHVIDEREVNLDKTLLDHHDDKKTKSLLASGQVIQELNDQTIKEYFSKYGTIEKIIRPRPQKGNYPRFVFIIFDEFDALEMAIAEKNHKIDRKPIDVKKSKLKPSMPRSKH